jgi:aminoglycoside 6'-N-acetyltransferase
MTDQLFQKDRLIVRKLQIDDWQELYKWLTNPEVAQFYEGRDQNFTKEKIVDKFYQGDETTKCLVLYDDVAIGYIQYYPIDEEEREKYHYSTDDIVYGIDQFIGESSEWNKGIGTKLVLQMVRFLQENMEAKYIVLDPQVSNTRAIRCYEKVGFQKKKKLIKNEFHEGKWRDCWLMELKNN